ncbi:hypothetical protein AU489_10930 [Lonsdalea populi]|uniref:Uncharacterized protein n=2 Tax=Lonsdalea TaxID=1082702 RepID=A0ACD1JAY9_9GAMM|nr:hypothetical protein AU485_12355 [Lonsdalea quercina]RAT17297.1 hypothetical protein AU487_16070 [Lonsdalea populi]RAT22568.1 hypothetical protein AU488_11120 [Lonsdalea populi]RAT23667.1 hypothetical protein AU489_10930 [Lonsdalea populi]RAT32515.1 hypothetical protein AU492_12380 [Lonsdalea populi]
MSQLTNKNGCWPVHYDWLGQHPFTLPDELQNYAAGLEWFYNYERPDIALNDYTPMQHIQHTVR